MVQRGNAQFAEFVAQLSADDAELLTDLKSAEDATKTSAGVMQGNLDRVATSSKAGAGGLNQYAASANKAGQSSQIAARSVGALGAAASATGSQSLAAATQFATLAAASDELALSLSGAGLSGSKMLKVLGPIAIVTTVIAVAISMANSKFNALADSMEDFREKSETTLKPLREQIQLLRDRQAVRLGLITEDQAASRLAGRQSKNQEEFNLRRQILEFQKLELELSKKLTDEATKKVKHAAAVALHRQRQLEDLRREKREQEELGEFERRRAEEKRDKRRQQIEEEDNLRDIQISAAQSLIIQTGVQKPSDFITDPILKSIAQMSERLNGIPEPTTGTFGSIKVSSPLADVRGGEAIGQQQLSTAEKHKQISADLLHVAKQTQELIRRIELAGARSVASNRSLQITGNPR